METLVFKAKKKKSRKHSFFWNRVNYSLTIKVLINGFQLSCGDIYYHQTGFLEGIIHIRKSEATLIGHPIIFMKTLPSRSSLHSNIQLNWAEQSRCIYKVFTGQWCRKILFNLDDARDQQSLITTWDSGGLAPPTLTLNETDWTLTTVKYKVSTNITTIQ